MSAPTFCQVGQLPRHCGGSGDAHVQSTATHRPRPQAFGARSAPRLTFGFASKRSPSAPWARGLLSAFWERGSPDLPACGPRCGYAKHARTAHLHRQGIQDPREGPSLAKRTTQDLLRSGLARQAREGGEIKARKTSRGPRDVSYDDRDQAGASTRSVLVSSLAPRGQAQARSTEASTKGFHIGATRPRPAGRQDGGHHGAQDGVTPRAFCRRRLLLSG